jgi:anti-sigma-K factor RskA
MTGVDGALFWNRATGTWTLLASNVKPAPDGKAYELWIINDQGKKIAAGTFQPDATGHAVAQATLPPDAGTIAAAAVTDEPAAGVAVPTGQVQFLANVAAAKQ